MLEKVKRKATDMENIEFRQGALGDGILEKDKYDYILLVNMLGEIRLLCNVQYLVAP